MNEELNKLNMNLQLLASDDEENNEEEVEEKVEDTKEEEKVLTQEQFDKALTKRLEKERKKMMEEFKAQLEEEKRLASLSEVEKLEEERKKIQQERAEIHKEKMTAYAQRKLNEAKLPESALKYLVKGSVEEIDNEIEHFKNMYVSSISNEVEAKIGTGAPATRTGAKKNAPADSFLKGLGL